MKILTWLSTERLLICILFVAIFVMAVRVPADSDTWWHLKSGQLMVEQGRILLTDPFSYTRGGQPWFDHGWLAQIGIYLLYRAGGFPGLALGLAALVTSIFVLVYRQSPGSPYLRAFTTLLAAITSSSIWAARPQIVSFSLAAVVYFLLDRYKHRRERKYLYPLPLVVLLWANVHGGFATAFILLLCYLAGETLSWLLGGWNEAQPSLKQPLSIAVATAFCLLVVPLNPNGAKMLAYPFRTVSIGVLRDYIQEWASPDFHQLFVHPFIWLFLAVLIAVARSGRRIDLTDLTLVGGFAYMGLLASRNIALFALVAGPILARYAEPALAGLPENPRLSQLLLRPAALPSPGRSLLSAVNWLLLLLIVLAGAVKCAVVVLPSTLHKTEVEGYPAHAVDFIQREQPPGPLFNSYNWGGYLIWRLWPEYPIFVDGRTDLYDDAFLREYLDVALAHPGWQGVLDRYGVNLVLIESDGLLARFLARERGWQMAYRDDLAAVFLRSPPLAMGKYEPNP
jgi:hypothetical protein